MPRPRSIVPRSRTASRYPTSKELDLLILAGCSCLMTMLYHPVAETLQAATTTQAGTPGAIAAQVSRTASATPIHTTLPPKRESLRQEDEEERRILGVAIVLLVVFASSHLAHEFDRSDFSLLARNFGESAPHR